MKDLPDREAEPYFSQPVRQILLMLFVLALVAFGAYVAYPRVAPVFLANPYLNGFIALVFLVGVLACFSQVFQLISSVRWIVGFAAETPGHQFTKVPRMLAALAALLRSRGRQMHITASSARSIQDSVATRIDEARDITRYIVSLLIFLGLLGTFWGLATTVPAVVDTIASLEPREGDSGLVIFGRLMTGLQSQLDGMGTAFASSLLGLAGSLVVGLLELFAGHGQNRFYRELEDWLSTITRLGVAASDGEGAGEHGTVVYMLEQMAAQVEAMQAMASQTGVDRVLLDEKLDKLADSLDRLADQRNDAGLPAATRQRIEQVADNQERLFRVIEKTVTEGGAQADAESRMRLRSIDVQLLRILEEIIAGRQESVADLRAELAGLSDAIRAAAGQERN